MIKKQLSSEPWRIFRIMSEIVDGFEMMTNLGPGISFFGSSSQINENDKYYQLTKQIAKKLAQKKMAIITGGGFGLMQAANHGAKEGNGKSEYRCSGVRQSSL